MRVYLESIFPCSAALFWQALCRSETLVEVSRPILTFRPREPETFPTEWREGETLLLDPYLYGLIPLGRRKILFERIDVQHYEIQTRESDSLVKRWDHLMSVQSATGNKTLYTDDVEIQAGLLTPLVWLFAHWLYRHRHRRWQKVAKRLAEHAGAS